MGQVIPLWLMITWACLDAAAFALTWAFRWATSHPDGRIDAMLAKAFGRFI